MFPINPSTARPKRWLASRHVIAATGAILISAFAFAQKVAPPSAVSQPLGLQIVSIGGEPELRVDGVPFFVHAAQFDYFRVPPDLWIKSLERYRELGINTIDLRIPWNWHEAADGQFDFEGHTNPRRNLRALLQQIALLHLKLIARLGPLIGGDWRNGGYPAWLLSSPNFKMSASDVQKGIVPPNAELAALDANAAASGWLANDTHMSYALRWLTAVAKELAPYQAKNLISVPEPGDRKREAQEEQISGPLLLVALDDAMAIRPGAETFNVMRYLAELRGVLSRGGLDSISFVSLPDAGMEGLPSSFNISSTEASSPLALAGQWFFRTPKTAIGTRGVSDGPGSLSGNTFLTSGDASSLAFLAHLLGAQSDFPPFLSAFAATTFAPADDVRAAQSSPWNMLLASRLLLGGGIRGIEYSPLQDTLTPAGWATPSAARYFRWDAALDLAGNWEPRANSVLRNGQLISTWGAMLASSHVRADFGIVDLRASAEKTDETANSRYTRETEQLFRVASLAGYAAELVNPAAQSVDRLLRDSVIVISMSREDSPFQLSGKAQAMLVEFVKRGGTLAYFPVRPLGALLEPLSRGSGSETGQAGMPVLPNNKFDEWAYGNGHVIAAANDFSSWVRLDEGLNENRMRPESSAAIKSLTDLLELSGARRSLRHSETGEPNTNMFASQLVPNESSVPSQRGRTCVDGQLCAAALISVTNVSPDEAANESLEIADPQPARSTPTGATTGSPTISFDVTVPADESLLLPLHAPLCATVSAGDHCSDEVVVAGAELLGAERDGKTLELTFYAPARAIVRLHLESEPSKVELDEDIHPDNTWKQETGELEVHLLRGAAPDFRRVLRVHLRYTPHVKDKAEREKLDRAKNNHRDSEYEVFDATRFSMGPDAAIPTAPPLIVADANSGGSVIMASRNPSEDIRSPDFTIDGAFHGTGSARVFGGEQEFTRMRFQPSRNPAPSEALGTPPPDGLLRGSLAIRSGHKQITTPVLFLTANEAGYSHYQFDFERDGTPDWALESNRLRLIVSPTDGGRALALVDKSNSNNLITLGGALHDFIVASGTPPEQIWSFGDFSLNRSYRPEWIEGTPDASLKLTFREDENSSGGIRVEKTLRFTAPETLEAAYRISVVVPPPSVPAGSFGSAKSFISVLSVPVSAPEDGNTRFCWQTAPSYASNKPQTAANIVSDSHCEDFVPTGPPILVPDGVDRMEIQYPRRQPLAVEWTSGRAVILPKAFSAQVNFVVPLPASTEAPGEFTLRYTVGSAP